MNTKSLKAKGRRLQDETAKKIREKHELSESDCKPTPMSVNGPDVELSSKAQEVFPFVVECKNKEKINIIDEFVKHMIRSKHSKRIPLLVVKKNRSPILSVTLYDDFLKVHKGEHLKGKD